MNAEGREYRLWSSRNQSEATHCPFSAMLLLSALLLLMPDLHFPAIFLPQLFFWGEGVHGLHHFLSPSFFSPFKSPSFMKTESVSLHTEREMVVSCKTENYFVQEIITQNWLIFFLPGMWIVVTLMRSHFTVEGTLRGSMIKQALVKPQSFWKYSSFVWTEFILEICCSCRFWGSPCPSGCPKLAASC